MTRFSDSGHRPHGVHTGEEPENLIHRGPSSLRVTLDTWGPKENLFTTLYDELQSNWGDAPSRTVNRPCPSAYDPKFCYEGHDTGWCKLTEGEREYLRKCFRGETLGQVLEGISFHFCIDGVDRATTHQLVRTRVGAAFMQHGGRDNDWRHRPYVMPETIHRACADFAAEIERPAGAIVDWQPLLTFVRDHGDYHGTQGLIEAIESYLARGRALYAALVDAGIPWQDARTLLWTGQETYIHAIYNYAAMRGVIAKRAEFVMDWQVNCVAQLMLREIKMKCPAILADHLGAGSDLAGKDVMVGMESWSPVGKYPNPHTRCKKCGHAKENHVDARQNDEADVPASCEVCLRSAAISYAFAYHHYEPADALPRMHRPEQNPFWVLHPDSMNGHPLIGWVATNGTYPKEFPASPTHCDIVVQS